MRLRATCRVRWSIIRLRRKGRPIEGFWSAGWVRLCPRGTVWPYSQHRLPRRLCHLLRGTFLRRHTNRNDSVQQRWDRATDLYLGRKLRPRAGTFGGFPELHATHAQYRSHAPQWAERGLYREQLWPARPDPELQL